MLDYGFTRFDTVDMCRAGDAVCSVPVTGGTAEAVPMHAAESLTAALPIGHAPIRVTVEAPHFLYAPVPLDRQTGEAVYSWRPGRRRCGGGDRARGARHRGNGRTQADRTARLFRVAEEAVPLTEISKGSDG